MNDTNLQTFLCSYNSLIKKGYTKENAIKMASMGLKIKEEDSNKLLVYVGMFKVVKYINGAEEKITFDESKAKYKKYQDIETGSIYSVNMEEVENFEKSNTVIYRNTYFNNYDEHYQNFQSVKEEFFEGITKEKQDKVVLRLINSSENKKIQF